MTTREKAKTIEVLQGLYRINHPEAVFLPMDKTLEEVNQQGLARDLNDLRKALRVRPGRQQKDYLKAIRRNVKLAVDLFHFFDSTKMVLSAGAPLRGEFFVAPSFDLGSGPFSILFPAMVPVDNPQYKIVPAERFPENAWFR